MDPIAAAARLGPILPWLDLFGIALFAMTGALAAARRELTFITLAFFALMTGVGGGTIRDLLIGAPVFWVHDTRVAGLCLGIAVLLWFTPQRWWTSNVFDWLDAAGLAAYSAFGAAKALGYGVPPIPAAMMGVVTACAGGIIRDLLAGEPSILMRPELYVTAAALTASLQVGLTLAGLPTFAAGLIAAAAGFGLRAAAIHWKLGLPAYPWKP
ncbi:MAG: trimeric intracellular cation channel family protein [Sphingomonadales bacterium]|nr:MAG: trimeric intracellular cation channel family protein [Sphingomonadales bacterium]